MAPPGAGSLPMERLVQPPPVRQPGQLVGVCEVDQPGDDAGAIEHRGEQASHRRGDRGVDRGTSVVPERAEEDEAGGRVGGAGENSHTAGSLPRKRAVRP